MSSWSERCESEHQLYHHRLEKELVLETKYSELTSVSIDGVKDVIKTDEVGDLNIYNYTQCGDDSEDLTKQCRGVIFDGDTLVSRGYVYTEEHVVDDQFSWNDEWKDNMFFRAYEGTTVRLWFLKDTPMLSTNRRIDADNSRWGTKKSFGEMFRERLQSLAIHDKKFREYLNLEKGPVDDVFKHFTDSLDKSYQYTFFIPVEWDSRIVCGPDSRIQLLHVGTFDKDWNLILGKYVGVSHPEQIPYSDNIIEEHVMNADPNDSPGILMYQQNGRPVKFISQRYADLYSLRGNVQSVRFRYLQLRLDRADEFKNLYPEHEESFEEYEVILDTVADEIHSAYVARHVKRRYVYVPKSWFRVMRECHKWHCLDRKQNIVRVEVVKSVMNEQTPTTLNHMIKKWRLEERARSRNLSRE